MGFRLMIVCGYSTNMWTRLIVTLSLYSSYSLALECYECGKGSVNKLSCVAERQYYQNEDGSKHVTGLGQGSWEGVTEERLEKIVCREKRAPDVLYTTTQNPDSPKFGAAPTLPAQYH